MLTKHGAQRAKERAGCNPAKLQTMLSSMVSKYGTPQDGVYRTDEVTIIVQDGKIVTILDAGMTVVKKA